MEKYSDKTILTGIKSRKNSILEYLYSEYYPQVKRIVLKHGGQEQDAMDLFQEALIIIFKRLTQNELVIKSSFHNYFIVLCRFIWFRQKNINISYDTGEQPDESTLNNKPNTDTLPEGVEIKVYHEYISNQNEKIYQRHYRKLSGDCKRVLKMYFRKKSFRQIAKKMEYSGEDYARRKKYLCMQQLMKMISRDPEYIELKKHIKPEH